MVLREQFCILDSCCLSPMRRNSVLEELRVSRLAVIQDEISIVRQSRAWRCWSEDRVDKKRKKLYVVCIQVMVERLRQD